MAWADTLLRNAARATGPERAEPATEKARTLDELIDRVT
jgi:hypothetical protein